MKYYQVTITGVIPIEDGDPSPEHWPWTPKEEMLAQIDEHLLGIDIRFDPLLTDKDSHGEYETCQE